MICVKCSYESSEDNLPYEKRVTLHQNFNGVNYPIVMDILLCPECGQMYLTDEQATKMVRIIKLGRQENGE